MKFKLLAGAFVAAMALTIGMWPHPKAEAAPQDLYTTQTCLPDGNVRVAFSWSGANIYVVQQWLDLSLADNGWQPGTFLGNGPLAAAQQSVTWSGLKPNATHYVRINQWLPDGSWDVSPTFYITTANCATPSPVVPPPASTPTGDLTKFLAPIESAKVVAGSVPGHFEVQAKVGLPGGCAQKAGSTVSQQDTTVTVQIFDTKPTSNVVCTAIYGIYDATVDLGALTPGRAYSIMVNDKQLSFAIP